jgi:hypothetical protein
MSVVVDASADNVSGFEPANVGVLEEVFSAEGDEYHRWNHDHGGDRGHGSEGDHGPRRW